MVYFSSEIASSIGAAFLGEGVISGVVILVLIMFLSMGTSFSATSITREAGNFFLTKIMPVSYTKQIFVKFSVYLIISIPAIFISCFILAFVNFISYLAAFLMSIALCFIVIGNVSNSILIDIKRPLFQNLENGEILSTNKNVSSSIGIGFGISVLIGVGAIMLSFFINIPSIYLVLFGFGVPYACIESFRLFYKAEKRYYAIEV